MNTKEVADVLGTTSRRLRAFLRSDSSTFEAVGSGARYDFTDQDVPVLRTRFAAWDGSTKMPQAVPVVAPVIAPVNTAVDAAVWEEEGAVTMPDIRDPRVRRAVREIARIQELRLEMLLMARGLHISQMGCRIRAA